jgi:hypothetical protein
MCGDVIESKHRHDFVKCGCGHSFLDGGYDYTRYGGRLLFVDDSFDFSDKDIKMSVIEKKYWVEGIKEGEKRERERIVDVLKKAKEDYSEVIKLIESGRGGVDES